MVRHILYNTVSRSLSRYTTITAFFASVSYKGQTFTRNTANTGGVLAPHITTPSQVSVLASANCTDSTGAAVNCNGIAQTTGTSFPWAMRCSNLTYIGENPLAYTPPGPLHGTRGSALRSARPHHDRRHRALVRIEDVNPSTDPTELRSIADYLSGQHVPFSVATIPTYLDPNGFYNNGVPVSMTMKGTPQVASALKYMVSKGGTLVMHGYTHQNANLADPYDAVTATTSSSTGPSARRPSRPLHLRRPLLRPQTPSSKKVRCPATRNWGPHSG